MKVDDQIPAAAQNCTVADYLLERLVQLKVTVSTSAGNVLSHEWLSDTQNIFGVPGDFNLGTRSSFSPLPTNS